MKPIIIHANFLLMYLGIKENIDDWIPDTGTREKRKAEKRHLVVAQQ